MYLVYSKTYGELFVTSKTKDELNASGYDVDVHEEVDNEELKKKLLHVLVDGTDTTLPHLDTLVAFLAKGQLMEMSNEKPVHTVLFTSRNKDNKDLPDFKQRSMSFTTHKSPEELKEEFERFVDEGRPGEMTRFYYSVNARDNQKTLKALAHELLDGKLKTVENLQSFVTSLASKTENRASSHWMFNYDDDVELVDDFVKDVEQHVKATKYKTPNGYAVVVEHGFDTRELLSKWKDVELKRDDMLCVAWNRRP